MCVGVCMCVRESVCEGVCVDFVICGCFGNMCTSLYCVFVLFLLCIFLFVTSVRITATE